MTTDPITKNNPLIWFLLVLHRQIVDHLRKLLGLLDVAVDHAHDQFVLVRITEERVVEDMGSMIFEAGGM